MIAYHSLDRRLPPNERSPLNYAKREKYLPSSPTSNYQLHYLLILDGLLSYGFHSFPIGTNPFLPRLDARDSK